MKKSISTLLILSSLLLLCACGGTGAVEPTPEPTAEPLAFSDDPNAITDASANIVMLTTYDKSGEIYKTGSGFPAFEDGYIVTNYHVIEGADRIEGNTEDEMFFKIDEIAAADKERDIAILKTNAKTGLIPLALGDTSALQKGEKVVAIGSPLGLINTVSDGMYSNRRTEDGQEYLQFTAAISPGSSGGALFNDKGEVIGITSASYTEGQNLNLAIPSEVVQDVWENKGDEPVNVEDSSDAVEIPLSEYVKNRFDYLGMRIRTEAYVSSTVSIYNDGNLDYRCFIVEKEKDVYGEKIFAYDYLWFFNGGYQHEEDRQVNDSVAITEVCFIEEQNIEPGDHVFIEFSNSEYATKNGIKREADGRIIRKIED